MHRRITLHSHRPHWHLLVILAALVAALVIVFIVTNSAGAVG